jgi:hypothetical protein
MAGLRRGEAAAEQVEEESFAQAAVGGLPQGPDDGLDERSAGSGEVGEDLFASQDVGGGEAAAVVGGGQ